jgi:hypothetical protein
MENSGKQNPKNGVQVPPRAEISTPKCLVLNTLRSKMPEQIQNLDPHRTGLIRVGGEFTSQPNSHS